MNFVRLHVHIVGESNFVTALAICKYIHYHLQGHYFSANLFTIIIYLLSGPIITSRFHR